MSDPYCRHRPMPGEFVSGPCVGPDGCGHSLLVHIGVEHCPVCELEAVAQKAREREASEPYRGPAFEEAVLEVVARAMRTKVKVQR